MIKNFKYMMIVIALTAFCFLMLSQNAYAYIDLGTGSYVFQIAIAFVVGGLFSIKMHWRKIVLFITNLLSGAKNKEK